MDASWFNTPFNRTSAASPPKESARQLNLDHEHGTLFTLLGKKSLDEGHGFSRAVNDTAMPGFSRWGTVFLSSEFSYAVIKMPSGALKPWCTQSSPIRGLLAPASPARSRLDPGGPVLSSRRVRYLHTAQNRDSSGFRGCARDALAYGDLVHRFGYQRR